MEFKNVKEPNMFAFCVFLHPILHFQNLFLYK